MNLLPIAKLPINRLILVTSDFIRLLLKWVDTPRLQYVYNQLEPKIGYNTDITGIKKITRWNGSYWHWADEINARFELGFIPYRLYQEQGKPPSYMLIHTINDYVYVVNHSGVQDITWLKIEDESSSTHLVYYAKGVVIYSHYVEILDQHDHKASREKLVV